MASSMESLRAMGIDVATAGMLLSRRPAKTALQHRFSPVEYGRCDTLPCTSGSSRISLLSYNILNPFVVNIPGQEHTWFHSCPPAFLDWERRKKEIRSAIVHAGADVVCLQEVFLDGDHKKVDTWRLPEWMGPLEVAGYTWIAKSLRPRKTSGTHDGNVVLFKRNRFDVVFDEGVKRRAMVAGLRARDSGALFAVCNVHLEGSPDAQDERRAQFRAVLDKVQCSQALQGAHVIIAGDFNSETSEFTEFLGSGTALGLSDAFPSADGPCFGAVTVGRHHLAAIDHVLLDASIQVLSRRRVLNSEAELEELRQTGAPSAAHPSDHLPLALVFEPTRPSLIALPVRSGNEPREPSLSSADAVELCKRWEEVQASKPAGPGKGKPSEEYIQLAKDFRSREKAFLDGLPDSHKQWLQQFGKRKGS